MDESSRSSNDSVEIQVEGDQGHQDIYLNGHMDADLYSPEDNGLPRLEIVEQPQQRGFRFRYECEGPSHGGLQGNSTEKFRKTVPTVRIRNYKGPARIIVTLVTDESVPKPHAHKLVGRHCNDGRCVMDVKPGTPQITFPNLCIQHVTRRRAADVLQQRICEALILHKKITLNDFSCNPDLSDEERKSAETQAEKQARSMKLNVVRLCFQACLLNNSGVVTKVLEAVVSDPIYDSKAPGANALKICRMDKYSGCCTGGEEVFLLCEKVQRDDILVRFVEQDRDGNVVWESYGNFGPFDVHRQFAIVFKTPEYKDTNIKSQVNVLVMLQRKSDSETSDPKCFTYHPKSLDKEDIYRKRKKVVPSYPGNGGYGDMDGSNYRSNGDNSNGSNGNMNGNLQNGGSLPHFDNMSLIQTLGNRPLFAGSQGQRQRPILHAARKSPQSVCHVADFKPQISPLGQADLSFMSQPQQFVFEEVSTLSPPGADPNTAYSSQPSPQGIVGNQQVPSFNNAHVGSPSHMAVSPMSLHGSPQHYSTSPPQMVPLSSQNILEQSAGHFQPQGMSYRPQHQGLNDSITVTESMLGPNQSALHTTMGSTSLMNQPTTEPVQATTSIGSDNLDIDFIISNTAVDYGTNQSQLYLANQEALQGMGLDNQFPNYAYAFDQSCGYMARGGSNVGLDFMELEGGLDCVDGMPPIKVGKDAALVSRFKLSDAEPKVPDGAAKEKLYARQASITKRSEEVRMREKSVKETLDVARKQTYRVKQEPAETGTVKEEIDENLDVTAAVVKKEVMTEGTAAPQTSVPAVKVTTQTTDVNLRPGINALEAAVQTDMDSSLLLAVKMSHALHHYAGSGDIRALLMVQRYLMAVQDNNGDLPLHTALINQKYEVFQNILDVMVALPDAYCRINAYNFHHQTPLHLAVLTNQPHAVDLLLRAGADSTLVDRNGYTAAHLAVLYGFDDCLKNLVKFLRSDRTIKNPFPELNIRCYDGFTPCHLAAQNGNLSAMKILVYGKAEVNLTDGKSGGTPLHHAVEADELSIAAYLILQAGANVNAKRFDGNTPLHIGCGRANVGMVALLMAGGADPHVENEDTEEGVEEENEEEVGKKDEQEEQTPETDQDIVETTQTVVNKSIDAIGTEKVMEDLRAKVTDGGKKEQKPGKEDPREKVTDGREKEQRPGKEDKNNNNYPAHSRKGLTPADFAGSNEKILRILNGEPYSSLQEEDAMKHTVDSFSSMKLSTRNESGICSLTSDLDKLDYPTRLVLSEMLDPCKEGQDWLALAEKLGLKSLVDGQLGENSPTRLLLTYFEESGGTLSRLTQALVDLNRADALHVLSLRQTQQQTQEHLQVPLESKVVIKDPQFDSGHIESFRKTPSPSPDKMNLKS